VKRFLIAVKVWFAFFAFTFLFSIQVRAQGNLMIMPKRVVFEGSQRTQVLNLANVGQDSATYAISLVQIRMKEDGSFEEITEPDSGQYFATRYLRYFPRTVRLAPNEAQTVRVQVNRSGDMVAGEYRSHLYFRAVPRPQPLGTKEPAKPTGLSVQLVPVFGISIPVIVKVGESTASVTISDAVVQAGKDHNPILAVTLNRTGNTSVYGDISVDHISPQGKITRVGIVRGIAVYSPTPQRRYSLALNKSAGVNYRTGKLRIIYSDQSAKALTLAEQEFVLN
jgi:hypothetical protein